MRILLDHCIDWRLARSLVNHQVKTARDMGWEQLKNGQLLAQAAIHFDVVITVDRNMKQQQNLATLPVAVLVLIAKSNKLSDLLSLVPAAGEALSHLKPRSLVEISQPNIDRPAI